MTPRGSAAVAALAAAVLACAAATARAQAVTTAPLQNGGVTFAMRATIVNDFTGRAPVARAEFSGSDLANVTGTVEVRVADMRTGIGRRDAHLREAMRADSFPTIRFDLTRVAPGAATGDTLGVTFHGNLTIHGVTRTVEVPGTVVLHAGGAGVTAVYRLDMRDYGIVPPTRNILIGTIRVQPVTQVTARLEFSARQD